jgi:DNA-binding PadR family transcriptional regulator
MSRLPSHLDYALLGLLALKSSSGYELRKIFKETPLGMYSDSPGSIYPALRRLEARGFARAYGEAHGRRRRVLKLTAAGRAALKRWLAEPVSAAQVANGDGAFELRLAFLSAVLPGHELRPFLRGQAEALEAYLAELTRARGAMAGKLSRSAALALDLGITLVRARAAWCRTAARKER